MNNGTKLRTLVAVLAAVNQALSMTDVPDFGNETANTIYKVVSWIISVIVLAVNTWYNNDYTETAARYTGEMRQAKLEESDDYEGERFEDDIYPEEEDGGADEQEGL